eukprot:SAG31_NODE_45436_length_259_cov_0.237500_1_plen_41_part_01
MQRARQFRITSMCNTNVVCGHIYLHRSDGTRAVLYEAFEQA